MTATTEDLLGEVITLLAEAWRDDEASARHHRRERRRERGPYQPAADRMTDYANLRSSGMTVTAASARAGISKRTGERHESGLAASGSAPWKAGRAVIPVPDTAAETAPGGGWHGTFLGALLHRATGGDACPACAAAETARRAEQAERNREVLGEGLRGHYRQGTAA